MENWKVQGLPGVVDSEHYQLTAAAKKRQPFSGQMALFLQNTENMYDYQYVPHKAVAEVSRIAHYRRLVAVKHGWQSKSTDGSKSGWGQRKV